LNNTQVIDGAVAKTVQYCDEAIKQDPGNVKEIVKWLNDNIIYHLFEEKGYYNQVNEDVVNQLDNETFKDSFVENVTNQHLFIEGPCFSHIDLKNLNNSLVDANEPVLIKKEFISYIKDRLKLKSDYTITGDVTRNNIFCVPMYVNKLFKLTRNIINTRDFGLVKDVTQQPVRGRAKGGGSRLGQMEIEALLSAGCELAAKEFLTVKSDRNEEKRKLVKDIINTGEYSLSLDSASDGQTKKVVSAILDFLKE